MKALLCIALWASPAWGQDVALSVLDAQSGGGSKTGVQVECSVGKLLLSFPKLLSSKAGSADGERPTVVESSESSASITYPSGAKLELRLAENGKITCAYESLSPDATGFLFSLAVRRESVEGGVFRFGEQAVTVPENGDKVLLVGNARGLVSLADSSGGGVQIDVPQAVQSLLDLRRAGVDEFSLRFQKPVTAPSGEFSLTVEPLPLR